MVGVVGVSVAAMEEDDARRLPPVWNMLELHFRAALLVVLEVVAMGLEGRLLCRLDRPCCGWLLAQEEDVLVDGSCCSLVLDGPAST